MGNVEDSDKMLSSTLGSKGYSTLPPHKMMWELGVLVPGGALWPLVVLDVELAI